MSRYIKDKIPYFCKDLLGKMGKDGGWFDRARNGEASEYAPVGADSISARLLAPCTPTLQEGARRGKGPLRTCFTAGKILFLLKFFERGNFFLYAEREPS